MKEIKDTRTGAIIFKKDDNELAMDRLLEDIKNLKLRIEALEKLAAEKTRKKV